MVQWVDVNGRDLFKRCLAVCPVAWLALVLSRPDYMYSCPSLCHPLLQQRLQRRLAGTSCRACRALNASVSVGRTCAAPNGFPTGCTMSCADHSAPQSLLLPPPSSRPLRRNGCLLLQSLQPIPQARLLLFLTRPLEALLCQVRMGTDRRAIHGSRCGSRLAPLLRWHAL